MPAEPDIIDAEVEPLRTKQKRGSGFILFLLLVAIVAAMGGGIASGLIPWPLERPLSSWLPGEETPAPDAAQVSPDTSTVAPTPDEPAPAASGVVSEPGIDARLARLESLLGQVQDKAQGAVAAADKTAEWSALGDRVAALEKRLAEASADAQTADRLLAAMIAQSKLRAKVATGTGFSAELDGLSARVAEIGNAAALTGALTVLARHADQGAAALTELQMRFRPLPSAILRAGGGEENDWWAAARRWLSSLITVRRLGEVEGDGAQAVVARAEARLGASDLAGALEALAGLTGPARDAAADWMALAKARVECEGALAEIETLLQTLAASRGPGSNAGAN